MSGLGTSSMTQELAAGKAEEGKEKDIKDIKVDSKILISNLFIHFYNWSKQAISRLLIITSHVICHSHHCYLQARKYLRRFAPPYQ